MFGLDSVFSSGLRRGRGRLSPGKEHVGLVQLQPWSRIGQPGRLVLNVLKSSCFS